MKRNRLLGVLFLFVLTSIATFALTPTLRAFFARKTAAHKVFIDSQGFSSSTVEIKPGETITWIARGDNTHWPASDFHPTHNLYPEGGGCIGSQLDSCRALKKGEAYSFHFNKIGVWRIHDHLYPGLTMTVEVGNVQKSKESINSETFAAKPYSTQKEIIMQMTRENPKKAWEYLKETFIKDGQVVGNAHEFAHIVGNETFKTYGFEGIQICDNEFAFGCYHGVTEKMLLTLGQGSITKIEAECLRIWPPDKSQNFTGCIHGMGHGLIGWRALDITKALEDCNALTEKNRHYCHNGVIMEYTESAPKSYFDLRDPWKLCRALGTEYNRLCGQYQIIVFTQKYNFSFSEMIKACSTAPNPLLRETCFLGIGNYITQKAKGNFDKIKTECRRIPLEEDYGVCMIWAADQVVFQEYKNWSSIYKQLCHELRDEARERCFAKVEETIQLYNRKPVE